MRQDKPYRTFHSLQAARANLDRKFRKMPRRLYKGFYCIIRRADGTFTYAKGTPLALREAVRALGGTIVEDHFGRVV